MTQEAVDKIVRKKLNEYANVEREEVTPAKTYTPSRPTKVAKTYRRVTTQEEYEKLVPAIKTPSAFSKAKVDEVLVQCRELPTPDKPQKNYAGYSRQEWDTLLEVLSRYTADVCEGAGLQYKSWLSPEAFRKALSLALQENFLHVDPYDNRKRYISVDGRIDSDTRKP